MGSFMSLVPLRVSFSCHVRKVFLVNAALVHFIGVLNPYPDFDVKSTVQIKYYKVFKLEDLLLGFDLIIL